MLTPSKRIMSLKDPQHKMSKSDPNEQARITLSDTDDQISRKIKKAPTDALRGITYDPSSRPGVSNLLNIYAAIRGTDPESAAMSMHAFSNAQLKEAVAEAIISELAPIRQEMRRLLADKDHIDQILCNNETKARDVAHTNWKTIAECIGLKA
ncbi:Tryptophan--tRNA ligase, mitochondrial [Coemansia erecta]|nr:Tryptophan--tRNA ligase, mitochondrial [Coemansia erecta]